MNFGGYETSKCNIEPLFMPQNRQNLAENWTLFLKGKCLTVGMLKSKLLLIILVTPLKFHSE